MQEYADAETFFWAVAMRVIKVFYVLCVMVVFMTIMIGVACIGIQFTVPPSLDSDRYSDVFRSWWTLRVSHVSEAKHVQHLLDATGVPLSVYSYSDHRFIAETVKQVAYKTVFYLGSWLLR